MPQSGLTKRLQQHSRRSGFAVGLSMVLAIAICFAAFTWIYVQLEPWVQDFAGAEEAPPTRTPRPAARDEADPAAEEPAAEEQPAEEAPVEDEEPAIEERAAEEDEDEPEQFEPDYVMSSGEAVNFRREPTSAGEGATIIDTLDPGTPLQSTGERAADTAIPENGEWMQFRLEDGTDGWLRVIDVSPT